MSHTTTEPSDMHYNNPSLIKFVSWLVLGGLLNPNVKTLTQSLSGIAQDVTKIGRK